jgi:HSP20 family protein
MAYRRPSTRNGRIRPLDHLETEFVSEVDRIFERLAESKPGLRSRVWPDFDTFQRSDRFIVRAELPGVAREDVLVRVVGDTLEIEGMRHQDGSPGAPAESGYGRLWRRIVLPAGCDPERATAWFTNGVLEVVVPFHRARADLRSQWAW